MTSAWSLLVYKLPSQPSRLRLTVWRKLTALGAIYVQDGVCMLPQRDDLDENLQYIADQIAGFEGAYHLLEVKATAAESAKLTERFRNAADERMQAHLDRLEALNGRLAAVASLDQLNQAEEEVRREWTAFLKARRLSFCGSNLEAGVEENFATIRQKLESLVRGEK